MEKIVGVKSADNRRTITEEDLQKMEAKAREAAAKIVKKPELSDLYAAIDDLWAKGLNRQLIFKNKDQHIEYITTYYKEKLEGLTLDQYKSLVLQQMLSQIDRLRSAVDSEKQLEAMRLHKEHEEKMLKNMQEQVDDLRARNEKADSEIREELKND